MLAASHPQPGIKIAYVPERTVARREALDAALQLGDVAAGLGLAPPTVRVADDIAKIGLG